MNTKTAVTLPLPVSQYFEAANRFDAPAAAECFTSDAVVHDEGGHHAGKPAIQRWVSQAGEKYQVQATVLSATETGAMLSLRVHVAGQFPGSPVELEFSFTVSGDKIAHLSIQ